MTYKEIIIDGIDVSGCDCYIKEQLFPNNLKGGYYPKRHLCDCGIQGCENYPFFCKDNPNCYYKQLKRLEQENARLRMEAYKQGQYGNRQFDKYYECYQTLQAIKEIAEATVPRCNKKCDYEYDCCECHYDTLKQILQKIA